MQLPQSTNLALISDNRTYILQTPTLHDSSVRTYSMIGSYDVVIVNFHLPRETSVFERLEMHRELIKELIGEEGLTDYTVWTNRCKSIALIRHLNARSVAYDYDSDLHDVHPDHLREMQLYVDTNSSKIGKEIIAAFSSEFR